MIPSPILSCSSKKKNLSPRCRKIASLQIVLLMSRHLTSVSWSQRLLKNWFTKNNFPRWKVGMIQERVFQIEHWKPTENEHLSWEPRGSVHHSRSLLKLHAVWHVWQYTACGSTSWRLKRSRSVSLKFKVSGDERKNVHFTTITSIILLNADIVKLSTRDGRESTIGEKEIYFNETDEQKNTRNDVMNRVNEVTMSYAFRFDPF